MPLPFPADTRELAQPSCGFRRVPPGSVATLFWGRPIESGPAAARSAVSYIDPMIMMCAFGVPGNISQGDVRDGLSEMPVVADVA